MITQGMLRQHWEVRVTFKSSARPQDAGVVTHEQTFKGSTKQEAIEKMEDYTGDLPKRPSKLYRDGADGEPLAVGYVWAGWVDSYDRANPGSKHWQERYAEIVRVTSEYGL